MHERGGVLQLDKYPHQLGKLRGDNPKLDRLQTIKIWITVGGAMTYKEIQSKIGLFLVIFILSSNSL